MDGKAKGVAAQQQCKTGNKNIEKLAPKDEAADNLISYYQTNSHRMDYKKYKQIGCGIIGSGAIESAHRTVVQNRMKQSGQRWRMAHKICLTLR